MVGNLSRYGDNISEVKNLAVCYIVAGSMFLVINFLPQMQSVHCISNDEYRSANYDSLQNTLDAPVANENTEPIAAFEREPITQQQPQLPSVGNAQPTNNRLSREYQLGYQNGYDDGEEDAYYGDGWEASFDDSNRYSGKKKHDYELGYLEGYEAGYDDNFEGTDD